MKEKFLLAWMLMMGATVLSATPFAHQTSDLPYDERVTYGVLENGMAYAIMRNEEPPEKVSLRLLIKAGSLQETETQRGLAHFLEHMAFNGSTHYPPGELITLLQNLGMEFGSHTNAHTSFDETVYKLEMPRNDEKTLKEGLKVMRDYADGLLLLEEEIERERGIIINEKNARDSVGYRTYEKTFAHLFPKSRFTERFPIGTEKVIQESTRSDFVDYYERWYRPENAVFIAVGDLDVAEMESLIAEYFSSWKQSDEELPRVDLGQVGGQGFQTFYHYEEEAPDTNVSLLSLKPYQDGADRKASRTLEIKDSLVSMMMGRRLSKLAKEEDSVFKKANFYIYGGFDFYQITEIEVNAEPRFWKESIAVVEQELRRALEFGFNQAELEIAQKSLINSYEQATRSAGTRKSRSIAVGLRTALSDDRVFSNPLQNEEFAKGVIASLNVSELHKHLRMRWAGGEEHLLITGNTELENPKVAIKQAYDESLQVAVTAPQEEEQQSFAYTDFGDVAEIISDQRDEELGVRQLVFSNQVRVNLLQTDFEEDVIRMLIQFGGGQLEESADQAGLAQFASMTFIAGGLEAHSVDDLRSMFAGKTASLEFGVGADRFSFSGVTNRKDSLFLFQKAAAYFTAPGYREEAFRQAKKSLDGYYKQLETTVGGVMTAQVSPFLMQSNHRAQVAPREKLEAYTSEDVKEWLASPLKNAYIEIGVVGDFDEDQIITQIAQTIGALPERAATPHVFVDPRQVDFPEGISSKEFTYQTALPRAFAGVYWPTTDQGNVFLARRLNMLARVFDERLRVEIREKYGDAYSPYAMSNASTVYENYGYLAGVSQVTPGTSDRVSREILKQANYLFENGITEDQFERAKKPLLSSLSEYRRRNSYWLERVLVGSQADPLKLYWAKNMEEDYAKMTREEVDALARAYLDPKKAVRVEIFPEGTVEQE